MKNEIYIQAVLGRNETWGMFSLQRSHGPSKEAGINWHLQNNYACNIILEGTGTLACSKSGQEHQLGPGCMYQHFPDHQQDRLTWESENVDELFVILDPQSYQRFTVFGFFPETQVMQLPSTAPVMDLAKAASLRLRKLQDSPLDEASQRRVIEVMSLLSSLFQLARSPDLQDRKERETIEQICLFFEQNPENRISLPELASQNHISYPSLRKKFHQAMGMSLNAYRILCRIHAAQNLLLQYNVEQTALQLGYADAFVFSNQFKRHCGVSPSTYRNRALGRSASPES